VSDSASKRKKACEREREGESGREGERERKRAGERERERVTEGERLCACARETNGERVRTFVRMCVHMCVCVRLCESASHCAYGLATIRRLLKITGFFCKRALLKRLYSEKETYDFKEPTNRSHPM